MTKFRELPGLPPYGPMPKQFSSTGQGTHREGYVVEFLPASENKWIANFQPGLSNFYTILEHPNGEDIIVIAGSAVYVVSPVTKALKSTFGGQLEFCAFVDRIDSFVLGNGLWFEIVPKEGKGWQTKRISWDGMRNIEIADTLLTGEAYDPMTDKWLPFEVNLIEGSHQGGNYNV